MDHFCRHCVWYWTCCCHCHAHHDVDHESTIKNLPFRTYSLHDSLPLHVQPNHPSSFHYLQLLLNKTFKSNWGIWWIGIKSQNWSRYFACYLDAYLASTNVGQSRTFLDDFWINWFCYLLNINPQYYSGRLKCPYNFEMCSIKLWGVMGMS